jgi:hypothetical protein
MIYLFMSFVRFQLKDINGFRITFKKALKVIHKKSP